MYQQQPFGPLPKIPPTRELWKSEPNKYRLWVILFIVSLISIVAISITTLALLFVNKSANINAIQNYITDNNQKITTADALKEAENYFNTRLVIWPAIIGGLTAVAAILFIPSLFDSYSKKSFSKLHGLAGLSGMIIGFVGLINIITIFSGVSLYFGTTGALLLSFLITPVSIIFGFFGFKINGIRKLFLVSERVEKLKNDPNFQKMQEQMQNMMSGMNPNAANAQQNNAPATEIKDEPVKAKGPTDPARKFGPSVQAKQTNESSTVTELKKLPVASLRAIAKELSVSGYQKMKKDELIKTITRIKN